MDNLRTLNTLLSNFGLGAQNPNLGVRSATSKKFKYIIGVVYGDCGKRIRIWDSKPQQ